MNFFYGDALNKHRSLVTGESTPSYLLHRWVGFHAVFTVVYDSDKGYLICIFDPILSKFYLCLHQRHCHPENARDSSLDKDHRHVKKSG
jgi:hypothetical protein